ncbi:Rieske (2Fe-2S) protein [Marinobacter zhejiangensis]|uniref:Ferredoxin subunit of nitrite reductase or a ring-hydroxylating dioxygenase n=1 Tax=Marinobacter zhejiangensis TaxID=488535 RepID=A0A1I4MIN2_9GAMM|nr:Rieske 2Fe-2S domain-containing protein [Marinobacter zhejiangensis]SFM03058.1 Ferredoxin subunit of nitrite reductase or a ring-hydroxylating dioxygenase [Marinobacter zhejiangensis]
MTESAWHTVCPTGELKDELATEFKMDESPAFVISHKGRLHAFINRCPHLGIELNWMPGRFLDIDRSFIQCATHGALFTLDSGFCIAGPCQGEALFRLETRIYQGQVQVRTPEQPAPDR